MESLNGSQLSFPQRHWLILCIIVAIVSPIVVHGLQVMAGHANYKQAMDTKPLNSAAGGMSPSSGAAAPGDSAKPGSADAITPSSKTATKDTSYKVPVPPQTK